MSKPFDGEGPTLRDTLQRALAIFESERVTSATNMVGKALQVYSAQRDGRFWDIVEPLSDLVGEVAPLIVPKDPKSRALISKVHTRFEEVCLPGEEIIDPEIAKMILPLLDKHKTFLVCRDDEEDMASDALWKYEYQPGKFFYWIEWDDESTSFLLPQDQAEDYDEVIRDLREMLWEPHSDFIEIDYNASEGVFVFRDKLEFEWGYEGEQGARLISRWSKFLDAGLRRSVILHGPPGTGKSTLAQQAGRDLHGRVCYISVKNLPKVPLYALLIVLEILNPDIFIVDDLDRMATSDLDFFLGFFEESENHVPLLIATTNHIENLPNAMKRPGRFDEIWAVEPPKGTVRIRIINYLASLEGVELSDEIANKIINISDRLDLPGAYIRELLRRVSVLGESELDFDPTDLTFDADWRFEGHVDPFKSFGESSETGASNDPQTDTHDQTKSVKERRVLPIPYSYDDGDF